MMTSRLKKTIRLFWRESCCAVCIVSALFVLFQPARRQGESALPQVVDPPSPAAIVPAAKKEQPLETISAVSDSFRAEVKQARRTIPADIWLGLNEAGWRLQVAEFVVDAFPSLKGQHPRNWPAGMTWENTDALHMPKSQLLVLAEKRKKLSGEVVASSRVAGVLRHEVGHAFDMVTGGEFPFCSASPEFLIAYHRDTLAVTDANRELLAYFVNREKAGRQEAFAEAFALLFGGGSDEPHRKEFRRCFPLVMKYVEEKVRAYRPI